MEENQQLTFNILTFTHPQPTYTFHFSDTEQAGLHRVHKYLVPDEVVVHFGEQEHYYTSFDQPFEGSLSVTKDSKPTYKDIIDESGDKRQVAEKNTCFTKSVLKRYYNRRIKEYFRNEGHLVKPNFVEDIEVWLPAFTSAPSDPYDHFEKYTLRVQFATVTDQPELLLTYAGKSRVFKLSVADLLADVSVEAFKWVIYNNNLYKYEELPDEARRRLEQVYPVWNFILRNELQQNTEAPERGNRYTKFKTKLQDFVRDHISPNGFKEIVPITTETFIKVKPSRIGQVSANSNQLLFGENNRDIVPYNGMKAHGPLEISPYTKIQFFYIMHKEDVQLAKKIDRFFRGQEQGFRGLTKFCKTPYNTVKNFSIVFEDKTNPLPEIEAALRSRSFDKSTGYIAIYVSPINKYVSDLDQRKVYYQVKELLLKFDITCQALEAEKIRLDNDYFYSLPNIAIAILSKLGGTPWRLDSKLKNELIIGVGAFKHLDVNTQYIGSAFSFKNDGKFTRFECFRNNQTDELAGSILRAVKEYVSYNAGINRLIIHFYKNMSQEELRPIEEGIKELEFNFPVFVVTINKTESHDIVAFDNSWQHLMPKSGTFINIGYNRYLLFNNTRYANGHKSSDGYPFPVKLKIDCTDPEQVKDIKVVSQLIDQVYQFSRMYWKSVRQQNLPVTIKYPEMVAEMFPYFTGNEIPEFGKDNLWFL